jgi:hypothetical protein
LILLRRSVDFISKWVSCCGLLKCAPFPVIISWARTQARCKDVPR